MVETDDRCGFGKAFRRLWERDDATAQGETPDGRADGREPQFPTMEELYAMKEADGRYVWRLQLLDACEATYEKADGGGGEEEDPVLAKLNATREWTDVVRLHARTGTTGELPVLVGFREESDGTCRVVVAVRGTTSGDDWLTNIKAIGAPLSSSSNENTRVFFADVPDAAAHEGFLQCADSVSDTVCSAIRAKLSPEQLRRTQVLVTGHSLGGAVATLLAPTLSQSLFGGDNRDNQVVHLAIGAPVSLSVSAAQHLKSKLSPHRLSNLHTIVASTLSPHLVRIYRSFLSTVVAFGLRFHGTAWYAELLGGLIVKQIGNIGVFDIVHVSTDDLLPLVAPKKAIFIKIDPHSTPLRDSLILHSLESVYRPTMLNHEE